MAESGKGWGGLKTGQPPALYLLSLTQPEYQRYRSPMSCRHLYPTRKADQDNKVADVVDALKFGAYSLVFLSSPGPTLSLCWAIMSRLQS